MPVQLSQLLTYLPSFVLSCQGQLPPRTIFHRNLWLKGAWRSCWVPCGGELGCLPIPYLLAGCAVEVIQPSSGFAVFSSGMVLRICGGERRREGSLEKADMSAGKGVGENGAFSG